MKNLIITIFLLIQIPLICQTEVFLNINHRIGDTSLNYGAIYSTNSGYDITIDRLEYYVSQIQIIHDGGQEILVEDFWILVDASETTNVSLGSYNIETIEGIIYSIGVEPDVNHTDLTLWPSHHPLAPQSPTMHWGWTSGYKFIALEGFASQGLANLYQVHSLGDELYFQNTIELEAIMGDNMQTISLNADYLMAYENMDVTGGPITHGTFGEAITLTENFRDLVFSPTETTNTTNIQDHHNIQFAVYPNPAMNHIEIQGIEQDVLLQIHTLDGIFIKEVTTDKSISVSELPSGLYLISIIDQGQIIGTEKLNIVR